MQVFSKMYFSYKRYIDLPIIQNSLQFVNVIIEAICIKLQNEK